MSQTRKGRHPKGWRPFRCNQIEGLAVDLLYVHRAIAAAPRIGLGVVFDGVPTPQVIERYVLQGRAMEEEILSTLLLLDKTEPSVCDSCDCSLCHAAVLSAIGARRRNAGT